MDRNPSTSERYGRALLALVGGLLVAVVVRGPLTLPIPLVAAVACAAWYGGTGPGILVTALSSTVVLLVLSRSGLPGRIEAPILFVSFSLLLVWLLGNDARRRALATADDAADRPAPDEALRDAPGGDAPRGDDARRDDSARRDDNARRDGVETRADAGETARRRMEFMAEAGELLAGSLDYEETLARVARLAVPHVADWCTVDMLDNDGGVQCVAVAHVDPEKVKWATELQKRYPVDMSAANGLPQVLRSGRPEFYPLITDEMLVALAEDPEQLELARSIGYTSVMMVPLAARGRTLGAITFVTAESGRRFDQSDLALATDLARIAGLAVDNARLHRQVAASREWLEVTLGSIGDAVIATDDRGNVTFMNEVAEKLTAWSHAESVGRPLAEIFRIINETSRQPVESPVERVLRDGVIVGLANHTLLIDRNGKEWPIDDSAAPIRGRNGAIVGVVLVFHDVTEARHAEAQLQASRDQLDVILRSVADGITMQDRNGKLVFANDEGAHVVGFRSAEEMLATPVERIMEGFELLDEAGRPLPLAEVPGRKVMDGAGNASAVIRFRRKGTDEERWSIVRASPVIDDHGKVIFAINIFQDITERKRAEEELQRRFDTLQNIYQLSEAASRAEESHQIDDAALDGIERMLGATRSAILLFDERGIMAFRSWRNLSDEYRAAVEGHSPWTRESKDPRPVLVPDALADPSLEALHPVLRAEGIGALCFIPLVYRDRLIGKFMVYFEQPRPFNEEEIQLAETVARHVAFAIGRREDEEAIRFQAHLLDSVEQGVLASDNDGRIIYANRYAETVYGRPSAELIGMSDLDLVNNPEGLATATDVLKRLREGTSWSGEIPIRRADGTIFPALISLSPITSREGEQIGIVGVTIDVTERKRMMERLEEETETLEVLNRTGRILSAELELEKLLQSVTDAATDLTGAAFGAFFYNKTDDGGGSYLLYTLAGAPREHFEHLPMPRATEIFAPTFRGEGNVRLDDVRKDPRFGRNAPYHGHPPGHLPVVSYLAIPVVSRSGEVFGGLFFGHPEPGVFTERAERIVTGLAAQVAIAIDNARLYQGAQKEIAERRRAEEELKTAKETAEEANAAKDQFLAVLSHELRTPLTPVLSSVYALETEEQLPEDIRLYIQVIRRNVELEARLIDDLLDLTRISKGKLQLSVETADAHALLRYVLEICQSEAQAKQLEMVLELTATESYVKGDPARLQQVFWNLIKNAIKFTPSGGRVTIRSWSADGGRLGVEVSDTGIGIEPDVLPRIFNAFEQGEQTITRRFGGLGLGLAISKALVDMHGGELSVTSAGANHGSTFTVLLPIAHAGGSSDTSASDAPAERRATSEALKILIVDDHEDTSKVMKLLLERSGYMVFTAADVRSALEIAAIQPFDLLISDIGLPDGSGVDLMEKLRRRGPVKGIALSGFGMEQDVRRSKEAGFYEHLTKPVSFQRLHDVIQKLTS